MGNISVTLIVFFLVGIPQSFLTVLALHFFTRTNIDPKKYLALSLICTTTTYLIRFLPIALGVNTVLTLLVLITCFQVFYKPQLSKVAGTIMSVIAVFVLIAFSEVLNMLLLSVVFGQEKAVEMLNSGNAWIQGLSFVPSNVYFAILIFLTHFVIKKLAKRKVKHGKAGKSAGE